MKHLIIIFALLLSITLLQGQNIEQSFQPGSSDELTIIADYPGLTIHKGTGPDLKISGSVLLNGVPVPDAVSLNWDKNKMTLEIKSDVNKWENWTKEEREKFVKDLDCEEIKKNWLSHNRKYRHWNFEAEFEVWLPASLKRLNVKSKYGSITIDEVPAQTDIFNTYGSIHASAKNSFEVCELESTYSTVTLNMPANKKAEISLQSNYGEIFTNIDFDINKDGSTNKMYKTIIVGSLNNGGSNKIKLRSDYSNVYLKKT